MRVLVCVCERVCKQNAVVCFKHLKRKDVCIFLIFIQANGIAIKQKPKTHNDAARIMAMCKQIVELHGNQCVNVQ